MRSLLCCIFIQQIPVIMRRWTPLFTIVCIIMSCSNNEINVRQINDPNDLSNTNFLAEIEGIPLNADDITISETSLMGIPLIRINARNTGTNQLLSIQFPRDLQEGSHQYDLMPSTTLAFGSYRPSTNTDEIFTSTSGVICILNNDAETGVVEGSTFFTAVETSEGSVIELTFCEFKLEY